ncbi:ester cyclase [Spongiactinospora sp. TRM90649]|uniref:ester cyclase n=1 Tax=Spongiactinospora sp. TRM90649 TaxID=3031114 RepID=UPI0023F7C6B5|nr:ester cyclase [Spongiactinospora sp. TRM90649]MDF5758654.1 ester cyclase [Spongiactinospora sp. TRM90649]
MSAARNKEILRRFHAAISSGDEQVIAKTIDEVIDPDVLIGTPLPLGKTGREALNEVLVTLHRAFPDLRVEVEDVIAEEDRVVTRNTCTGTHLGDYMGLPPTGKSVSYKEVIIARFTNGRIVQTWAVVDVFSLMRQLGAIAS